MNHRLTSYLCALALTLTAAAAPAQSQPASGPTSSPAPDPGGPTAPWRNTTLSPDARARDLLARLTLDEKISLIHADGYFSTAALARFNIPKRWMSDGPQGVREEINTDNWRPAGHTDDFSTALPAGVGLAATFDESLAHACGDVIGEEAITRGKNIMLGPGVNIMRTPINGRNSEYFGEDPFLAARMTVNYIQGVQSHGVSSCVKHFAANNQETQRNSVNVEMDDRALHEIYLPAFKAAVTEAHVWSIMSAYNKFRGSFCSENDLLLNQILKKDWNFQGLVMSDWGGVHTTVNAALHGLDLEMGTSKPFDQYFFAAPFRAAFDRGDIPTERLDDMALRNLRVMAFSGLFDGPRLVTAAPPGLMAPTHVDAARRIAESAIVLLKNDAQTLPLDPAKIKSIAIIGRNANSKFAHDGNSAAIKTGYEITPLEGITKRAGDQIKVTFAEGFSYQSGAAQRARRGGNATSTAAAASAPASAPSTQPSLLAEAVAAAKCADVAIVCAGLYRALDQEGIDRKDLSLPAGQVEVIDAIRKANPRTIVILDGGGPVDVEPFIQNIPAALFIWYGGSEGGTALARILFGDVTPSGKLPCTFPKSLADSPAHRSDHIPASYPGQAGTVTYDEGLLIGYRWYDTKQIEPRFPFGFGLSYTTFQYSNLQCPQTAAALGDPTRADLSRPFGDLQFDLANTGPRDGAEAVQIYVHPNSPAVERPDKELKAIRKVPLRPGQTTHLSIPLPLSAFAYFDPKKNAWVVDPGDYTVMVAASSRDIKLKQTITLTQTLTDPRP